jgi:hypothetical protein
VPDEYTDAARARVALSAAARELSDDARELVDTEHETTSNSIRELVERVNRLAGAVEELRRLAVVYARERNLSWESVGEALGVTRQTAHERFAKVVDEWHDSLYDPARHTYQWLPDGAYNPDQTIARLETWLARHDEHSQPRGVAAGLPAYDALRRTGETLARANWLTGRLRAGQPITPEADADHQRRKDIALSEARKALGQPAGDSAE